METDATYRKGYKQGVLDATEDLDQEKRTVYNDLSGLGLLSFLEFTKTFWRIAEKI